LNSFKEIILNINEGKWQKLYLLVGDEEYQIDFIIDKLKQFFVSSFGYYETLYGDEVEPEKLYQTLNTLPSLFDDFNATKMFVLRDIDKLSTESFSVLNEYVSSQSINNCLIMTVSKIDKRKNIYKKICDICEVVEIREPSRLEWNTWKRHFEKRLSKEIEYEAWHLLLEKADYRLSLLWSELQKAAIYVGSSSKICLSDAIEISSLCENADIFGFIDDVVNGKLYESNEKYHYLIKNGESALKLISLLVRQFHLIDKVKRLAFSCKLDNRALSSKLGLPPFVISKLIDQARTYDYKKISLRIQQLSQCDFILKTGRGDFWSIFLSKL